MAANIAVQAYPYPETRRDESVVEDHFGTQVQDPYRWLENPDSKETQEWVTKQNDFTKDFIRSCKDWDKINQQLTKVYNYPKYTTPKKRGNHYFFSKNDGLQNQNVQFMKDTMEREPRL